MGVGQLLTVIIQLELRHALEMGLAYVLWFANTRAALS